MLWLIILLVLLFGGGGGYYGYSRWGTGGGLGIVGTIVLVLLVGYLLGGLRGRREDRAEPEGKVGLQESPGVLRRWCAGGEKERLNHMRARDMPTQSWGDPP